MTPPMPEKLKAKFNKWLGEETDKIMDAPTYEQCLAWCWAEVAPLVEAAKEGAEVHDIDCGNPKAEFPCVGCKITKALSDLGVKEGER